MKYHPSKIEPKWQAAWEADKVFETPRDLSRLKGKPKYYILDMFPYPSGAGLHVGHPEGYTATDVLARFKRMNGFAVLHPMGWDAFGLPAERAAMRDKEHPSIITKRNIDNFRAQIKRLGFSYDWSRELSTTDENYYKWTQWIFLKLHERGLAYMAEVPVNWCPALGTVLANEEVQDGKYVETGDPVEKRLMKQWMLKITTYAERLLEDLEDLDWPEGVKEMQRNWIGKSHGAEIRFGIEKRKETFTVFTTRADTLFGCTYCVLSPEHPLVSKIVAPDRQAAVGSYVKESQNKSELSRTDLAKEKTGIFSGTCAIHPVTGKLLPIWIADYVLMSYGTGAIMSVPAHDERDREFAQKFKLPIVPVINDRGQMIDSDFLNGLDPQSAAEKMTLWLEKNKKGKGRVEYRLRDWLFSRQRYWGEPFPILHSENGEILAATERDLPIRLPRIDEYDPTEDGKPPLARAKEWLEVTLPDGRKATRETNTMPQWAGSCWYYLRFIDPQNSRQAWDPQLEKHWMPVDLYIGGVEHAVLHLLYARFWHKVLYDCGLVSTKEPFQKLFNQGMILAHSYRNKAGKYFHPDDIETREGKHFIRATGEEAVSQIEKMSKSKLNVVNPDKVIDRYGADAMRLYELFMGPLDASKPWQMDGVEGVNRFLGRVWRLIVDEKTGKLNPKINEAAGKTETELWKNLHKTIKKVKEDTESLHFNTAISQMMIFLNETTSSKTFPREILETFLKVLAPYAPHIGEELWERLGEKKFLCQQAWPKHDAALCVDERITVIAAINGKKRAELQVSRDIGKKELEQLALQNENVQKHLGNATPKKMIVIPGKLVNIVV